MDNLLSKDFDPWYVMLSAPEIIKQKSNDFVERPNLPKKYIDLNYKNISSEAEQEAKMLIRERWRELRILNPEDQVATILSSKSFRNGNSLGVKEYLSETLRKSENKITFVLPSFPFKIPNPLKTWHHNLDAAEIMCLKRLYLITCITKELLNKPVEFVIISDGYVYSDICEIDPFEYKSYSNKAKKVIKDMGINKQIKYVDMVDDILGDQIDDYQKTLNEVNKELKTWWKENESSNRVKYLISNMKSDIKTTDLDYSAIRSINNENESLIIKKYLNKLNKRASQKAFDFTAKLITLRITNAVLNKYKGSIRATVHPKQGQYGIHLVNKKSIVFPWQGVLIEDINSKIKTTTSQLAWKKAKYEVFDKESGDFLFYTEKDSNIGSEL